jgi:GPH family glycoside/pentoside/hexuronide:cation symporter
VFFLFWTTFSIPYEALGAELSFDYDERNKIFGIREAFVVLGTVLSALCPLLLASEGNVLQLFPKLSFAYAGLLVLSLLIAVSLTKEKTWRASQIPTGNVFGNVKEVLSNRAFRLLLASYAIGAFSGALPATLILYYVEYVLGASESAANMFLLEYFVVGLVFLPAWVKLAEKWGKKEAWVASMLVNTIAFIGVFFLGKGDTYWYGFLVALSAIGYGATLALPSSMQADVIDYDEHAHGTRKEGQFVGLWAIAKKCASAVGAGIALWILGNTGYAPGQEQSESTVFALRVLYAGVPCLGNLIAIAIAWRYPITKEMHSEIRNELESRNDSPQ